MGIAVESTGWQLKLLHPLSCPVDRFFRLDGVVVCPYHIHYEVAYACGGVQRIQSSLRKECYNLPMPVGRSLCRGREVDDFPVQLHFPTFYVEWRLGGQGHYRGQRGLSAARFSRDTKHFAIAYLDGNII